MRVAVVHDWLVVKAGGEAVLEQILLLYPGADVFTLVNFLRPEDTGFLRGARVQTSFIQKLPFARKHYRSYLPLMPLAVEQFDLSSYDLIISSSHAVAKGVLTGPDQVHISYVHSPIRYAWDLQHTYLKEVGLVKGIKSFLVRMILHYIRMWDVRTSFGVDCFIANSHFIRRRIKKVYGRSSEVVYPPVDLEAFHLRTDKEDFYLTASRLVPYKKIPLIVEAFKAMPDKKLIVIGAGPEEKAARAVAGDNVTFLGYQPREMMADYMQRAKAFIFAAEEDFGITPVEVQSCGTPVIAYGRGGVLETVVDGETGLLFATQEPQAIRDAVARFEAMAGTFDPAHIRKNAVRFDKAFFRKKFSSIVERELQRLWDEKKIDRDLEQ